MVKEGDDLVAMFLEALDASGLSLEYRDLVIVTSKVVSKSEGQVVDFDGTEEHKASLIEGESARILRRRGPLRITETHHGFINANAGIDLSNTDDGTAVLLPKDPDRSARRFRAEIQRRCSVEVAVIITDTFGRVWRVGVTDVAIGSAGVKPVLDLRGTNDATGRVLEVTRSRSPTRSPARPIWCSARPKRHRSRSFAVSTTRTSVTVRSKKTLSVARTKTSFADYTPPRRTSPTVLRPAPRAHSRPRRTSRPTGSSARSPHRVR